MPHKAALLLLLLVMVVLPADHDAAVSFCEEKDGRNASSLEQARSLELPEATVGSGGEMEHLVFWEAHGDLLREAWGEWFGSSREAKALSPLDDTTAIHPGVVERTRGLRREPTIGAERALREALWEEAIPGVWVCKNFLTGAGIAALREHLEAAEAAGIPTRRPNGMNKHGLVLDHETEGGVTYPPLDAFVERLADGYVRPLGRMFFPEFAGKGTLDDASTYAFTIRYAANNNTKAVGDLSLPEHSDASVFTMNLNLNLPGSGYEGSSLAFADAPGTPLVMEPGMAVLHRGMHRHRALPISGGERHQLIVWLFGPHGYVRFAPYDDLGDRMGVEERWAPIERPPRRGLFGVLP